MKSTSILRTTAALLILMGTAISHAHAAVAVPTPEIDPSLAVGGLTLLSGVVMMVKGRRK